MIRREVFSSTRKHHHRTALSSPPSLGIVIIFLLCCFCAACEQFTPLNTHVLFAAAATTDSFSTSALTPFDPESSRQQTVANARILMVGSDATALVTNLNRALLTEALRKDVAQHIGVTEGLVGIERVEETSVLISLVSPASSGAPSPSSAIVPCVAAWVKLSSDTRISGLIVGLWSRALTETSLALIPSTSTGTAPTTTYSIRPASWMNRTQNLYREARLAYLGGASSSSSSSSSSLPPALLALSTGANANAPSFAVEVTVDTPKKPVTFLDQCGAAGCVTAVAVAVCLSWAAAVVIALLLRYCVFGRKKGALEKAIGDAEAKEEARRNGVRATVDDEDDNTHEGGRRDEDEEGTADAAADSDGYGYDYHEHYHRHGVAAENNTNYATAAAYADVTDRDDDHFYGINHGDGDWGLAAATATSALPTTPAQYLYDRRRGQANAQTQKQPSREHGEEEEEEANVFGSHGGSREAAVGLQRSYVANSYRYHSGVSSGGERNAPPTAAINAHRYYTGSSASGGGGGVNNNSASRPSFAAAAASANRYYAPAPLPAFTYTGSASAAGPAMGGSIFVENNSNSGVGGGALRNANPNYHLSAHDYSNINDEQC